MISGPRALVDLAVRVLPSWSRDRYAGEFHAELVELPRTRRWGHAATVLLLALPLRIAVLRAAALELGFHAPLHCLLGFGHAFRGVSADDGRRYRQCRRCGLDDPHLGNARSDWATGLQLGGMASWN